MDPFNIAGLVVGLYSTCRDCYAFYSGVKSAEKTARQLIRQLWIQESILKSWGFYWEITRHSDIGEGSEQSQRKLREYLARNPYKVEGVAEALSAIADVLSDRKRLLKYGVSIQPGQEADGIPWPEADSSSQLAKKGNFLLMQEKWTVLRKRMPFLKKCRWAVKDRDLFENLLSELRTYNDALYRLCPEGAFEPMYMQLVSDYLGHHKSTKGLKITSTMSQNLSENDDFSPSQQGLHMLADVAEIKVSTADRPGNSSTDLVSFKPEELDLDYECNLAIWEKSDKVVYIETKSYLDDEREPDPELRDKILLLGRLLCDTNSPKRLSSLKCLGLVDYADQHHIGFVYELPDVLGIPSAYYPAEDIDVRRPWHLFGNGSEEFHPPLGLLFDIARRIVRSVVLLHASGWLHKNIRPSSVIFFPKTGTESDPEPSFDFENPYLIGYGFSRQDDIADESPLEANKDDGPKELPRRAGGNLVRVTAQKTHIELDEHHHPEKRLKPSRRYRHAYDIYSLGMLLLQLGLRKSLYKLIAEVRGFPDDAYRARRYILSYFVPRLSVSCGEIYMNVVAECLSLNTKLSDVQEKSQRNLLSRIAADLSQCCA